MKDSRAEILEEKFETPCQELSFPRVTGLKSEVADFINKTIGKTLQRMLPPNEKCQEYYSTSRYRVEVNERGVLSLSIQVLSHLAGAAHPMTYRKSLSFDLTTGRLYELGDSFRINSRYIYKLSQGIKHQIQEQDVPLTTEFKRIIYDQDYYLTKENLVIYFQLYEYTPYAYGMPEFTFPYEQVINLVKADSPIRKLYEGL